MLENNYDYLSADDRVAIFNYAREMNWTPDQYSNVAQSNEVANVTPSETTRRNMRKGIISAAEELSINLLRLGGKRLL